MKVEQVDRGFMVADIVLVVGGCATFFMFGLSHSSDPNWVKSGAFNELILVFLAYLFVGAGLLGVCYDWFRSMCSDIDEDEPI